MNWVEKRAESYLKTRGYQTIFEPDGNCPPDIVVNGSIAVEVRRLNEIRHGVGLEHDHYRLHDAFADVLKSFGSSQGVSWWVSFRFKRPAPGTAELKRTLREFFQRGPTARTAGRIIIGNLEVWLQQASIELEDLLELYCIHDLDSGGSVVGLLADSANRSIEEKARKVKAHQHRYETWWLLLVNTTPYRLHPDDVSAFRSAVKVGDWAQVICVGLPEHDSALLI
jgi:hypothetical protein